jgi:hypothetical protein
VEEVAADVTDELELELVAAVPPVPLLLSSPHAQETSARKLPVVTKRAYFV